MEGFLIVTGVGIFALFFYVGINFDSIVGTIVKGRNNKAKEERLAEEARTKRSSEDARAEEARTERAKVELEIEREKNRNRTQT